MNKLLPFVVLLLAVPHADAGFIVGPGDRVGEWHDGAFDIIAVDLNSPASLGAGTYTASAFNYQFTSFVVGGGSSTVLTGSITPVLFTGGGTTFTPIAIGDTITYSGPTAFITSPFGGSDTFTLGSTTTLYGGLYWEATEQGLDERMPVGFENFVGNTFVVYGGGFGPGAIPPEIGTVISGSAQGFFSRIYDFSVEVNEAAVVPEPSALLLAISGLGLVGCGWLRRKRVDRKSLPVA